MRASRKGGRPGSCFSFNPSSRRVSEEADEAFPLLDLLLDLVAGGGDFCLRREDGTDEGQHGPAHGGVEGPAHGAEPGPVRGRVMAAVQLHLFRTPAGRVQHQTQDQEQTCRKRKTGNVYPESSINLDACFI